MKIKDVPRSLIIGGLMKSRRIVIVMAVGVWLFSSSALAIAKTATHAGSKKTSRSHKSSASHRSHSKSVHAKHGAIASGKSSTGESTLAKYGLESDSKTNTPKSTLAQYGLDGSSSSTSDNGGEHAFSHAHAHTSKHKKTTHSRSPHHKSKKKK